PVTMYYMCKADNKCPIRMMLKVNGETGAVTEYVRGPLEHTHESTQSSGYSRLPGKVMQALEDAYYGGEADAKKIHKELLSRFGAEFKICRRKVKYYVERLKEKQFGDLSFMRQTIEDSE